MTIQTRRRKVVSISQVKADKSFDRIVIDTLIKRLIELLEAHDPAVVLTTDAPEMTVGDSSSDKQHFTDEPCPTCEGRGSVKFGNSIAICHRCRSTGRVSATKPENHAPSPTPSFR